MSTHQIAVSQICRTIAHPTRLQLLWDVFEEEELCVRDLALRTETSSPNASNQLQALAAKELITPKRGKLKVVYTPTVQPQTLCAKTLLPALWNCWNNKIEFKTIIHEATSFTHERRIQIVRCLAVSNETFDSLLKKTGMTTPALNRHLKKLSDRNIIQKQSKTYQLRRPNSLLTKCLLELTIQQP